MHICFITYREQPLLTPDDHVLAAYLESKDITITAAPWNDNTVDWTIFDAIILRSAWDYHLKLAEFNAWLNRIERLGCTLLNPAPVIKWNQNKKYLLDLRDANTAIPPFVFCGQNSVARLDKIFEENKWEKAVIKPAVSCGSFNTWISSPGSALKDSPALQVMLRGGDVIVQKFVPEVLDRGELSLIFFNKHYSHSVIKKATGGDFRVQAKFGGTVHHIQPSATIINSAAGLLAAIPWPLLYARVDGVLAGHEFVIMELELIEPALFVAYDKDACKNFH